MKFNHLFEVFLIGSGITSSAYLAGGLGGLGGEVIGGGVSIPSVVFGPILVGAFTLIAYFLKQYYTAMVNVMTRQNTELHNINDKLASFDKRLAVVETKMSSH